VARDPEELLPGARTGAEQARDAPPAVDGSAGEALPPRRHWLLNAEEQQQQQQQQQRPLWYRAHLNYRLGVLRLDRALRSHRKTCADLAARPLSAPVQLAAVPGALLLTACCAAPAAAAGGLAPAAARLALAFAAAHLACVVAACGALASCGAALELLLAALWAARVAPRAARPLAARLALRLLLRLLPPLAAAAGGGGGFGGGGSARVGGAGGAGAARLGGACSVCWAAPAEAAFVHGGTAHLCVCRACAGRAGPRVCVACGLPASALVSVFDATRPAD
jgi:hypothetical protein